MDSDANPVVSQWPPDADYILENLRCNSIILSDYHKKNYFLLLSRLKYFRIPVIIISAFASVFNIGLGPFLDQIYISVLCCMLSLITGLIGSIELFLQVQKKMESELINSRDFYLNAIDIYKVLSLDPKHRNGDGLKYLDGKFAQYCKMIENSNIMDKAINDSLAPIEKNIIERISDSRNTLTRRRDSILGGLSTSPRNSVIVNKYKTSHETSSEASRTKPVNTHNKLPTVKGFFDYFFDKTPNGGTNHGAYDEIHEIGPDEKFDLYCDIIKKSKQFDKAILHKISAILTSPTNAHNISFDERAEIFTYLVENPNLIKSSYLDKFKFILIGDMFKTKQYKDDSSIEKRLNIYNSIMEHQSIIDDTVMKKIKRIILDTEKTNKDTEFELIQLLLTAPKDDIEQGKSPSAILQSASKNTLDLQPLNQIMQNNTSLASVSQPSLNASLFPTVQPLNDANKKPSLFVNGVL
jgi:hypothetical protein